MIYNNVRDVKLKKNYPVWHPTIASLSKTKMCFKLCLFILLQCRTTNSKFFEKSETEEL